MRLGARLAIVFAAVTLVASAAIGFLTFRATGSELDASIDDFLTARSSEIVRGLRSAPGEGRPGQRPNGGGAVPGVGPVIQFATDADSIAQQVRRDGGIVTDGVELPVTDNTLEMAKLNSRDGDRGDDRNDDELVHRFDDIEIDGEPHRMVSTALPDGGAVQVARSTEENTEVRNSLLARFALIAGVVAAVAALVGWLFARRTTRPLRKLSEVASDVASTRDFSTEIDIDRDDEIGQLASSFREMLEALEESREQQHRLVHDAGHELRTPLTSLRANIALLERATDLPADERTEVVDSIKSELVELSDLFDEMIELATDQHSAELADEDVDLHELVDQVAARWRRRSGRDITVEHDDHPVVVRGDALMIDRALSNLLSNAHKFSPAGGPIAIVATGGGVAVQDSGPGVPPADRNRIFDRFYRTDVTRSMPGSGLGLAIVAQIVERHRGAVFVDDAPGGGAEIGFRLPVAGDRAGQPD